MPVILSRPQCVKAKIPIWFPQTGFGFSTYFICRISLFCSEGDVCAHIGFPILNELHIRTMTIIIYFILTWRLPFILHKHMQIATT